MAARRGRCTNFGSCTIADTRQVINIADGGVAVCPDCGRPLFESSAGGSSSSFPAVAAGLVLLLALGTAVWWVLRDRPPKESGGAVTATARPAGEAASGGNAGASFVVLRMHGSNTIGSQLAPALAQAFLKQLGAQDIRVIPGAPEESRVQGTLPGQAQPQAIEIAAHGSSTAFSDLGRGDCDIGMASRAINKDEEAKLSSLGNMTSAASEHVLGLDGIAVIVNKSNPLVSLSKEQIGRIFSGAVKNWAEVGGPDGAIRIFARDENSGTYDTFKTLILGRRSLSGATRLEDSRDLSDRVAADPNAIGFVGLPYIQSAKALAVSEGGTRPLLPNRLTVATEDYPLSRRLFLYTAASSKNPLVNRFVDFALGKEGQEIVGSNGFVSQNVRAENVNASAAGSEDYSKLILGARRLSLNFRFKSGSSDPDNKALADLDRVVTFLSDLHYNASQVMLLGFADATGSPGKNRELSLERAKAVAAQFELRGVKPAVVTGFGEANPIASNENEDGRQRNRRVEIWVKER